MCFSQGGHHMAGGGIAPFHIASIGHAGIFCLQTGFFVFQPAKGSTKKAQRFASACGRLQSTIAFLKIRKK